MIKNKKIPVRYILFLFGLIIVLTIAVKFLILGVALDSKFYIAEFLSYALVLTLIYYLDYQLLKKRKEVKSLNSEIATLKRDFSKRESNLLLKIMDLEEQERRELRFSVNKEKSISKIFQKVNFDDSIDNVAEMFLISLSRNFELVVGIFYLYQASDKKFIAIGRYGIDEDYKIEPFAISEGFCGQAAADKKIIEIKDVPEDYVVAASGLGTHVPSILYFIPILKNNKVIGVIELGTFKPIEIGRIWTDINNKLIDLLKLS